MWIQRGVDRQMTNKTIITGIALVVLVALVMPAVSADTVDQNNDSPQKPEDCALNFEGGRCFVTGACKDHLKMRNCPKGYTHLYEVPHVAE